MAYVNNGYRKVIQLRQVAVYSDSHRDPTGVVKPNDPADPDYIAPYLDSSGCPVPTTTTTTSTTTTSTSTTTTSTTSTTTTTTVAPTPCDSPSTYSGGEAFPTEVIVTLGATLGDVTLSFDAFTIPDRFVVNFDGVDVIDTGYRGDPSYQSALDSALASHGLPPSTIINPGSGTDSFTKTTVTTTAIVKVYAPLTGTSWNFTLSCPVATTTTTSTTSTTTPYPGVTINNGNTTTALSSIVVDGTTYGPVASGSSESHMQIVIGGNISVTYSGIGSGGFISVNGDERAVLAGGTDNWTGISTPLIITARD